MFSAISASETANTAEHIPVMADEVMKIFSLSGGECAVDATCGLGGHAELIARAIGSKGTLLALDRDESALKTAEIKLKSTGAKIVMCKASFEEIPKLVEKHLPRPPRAVLFDLGVNSAQLEDPLRGFGFSSTAPPDMRFDTSEGKRAIDLIKELSEEKLAEIIYRFGEERFSRRIARALKRALNAGKLVTAKDMAEVVRLACPPSARYGRIHPATRTFQALRIAVNNELDRIERALPAAAETLDADGRLAVITFHSLEDRICKRAFKKLSSTGRFYLPFKKPISPSKEEVLRNPRSRSAKLRAVIKGEAAA